MVIHFLLAKKIDNVMPFVIQKYPVTKIVSFGDYQKNSIFEIERCDIDPEFSILKTANLNVFLLLKRLKPDLEKFKDQLKYVCLQGDDAYDTLFLSLVARYYSCLSYYCLEKEPTIQEIYPLPEFQLSSVEKQLLAVVARFEKFKSVQHFASFLRKLDNIKFIDNAQLGYFTQKLAKHKLIKRSKLSRSVSLEILEAGHQYLAIN